MELETKALSKAVTVIRHHGCVIYPTETFYALGANAGCAAAVQRIARAKFRHRDKPMPIIVGNAGQLSLLGARVRPELLDLEKRFWPGPLSVLVEAGRELPGLVLDSEGLACVRVSSHPLAQRLALRAGVALVATSANRAGNNPPSRPGDIDPDLAKAADSVIPDRPWPSGGQPSTIVRCVGPGRLLLIRSGAVSAEELRAAGYRLETASSKN
jgi:L-threonylcarbamoyladenylate synthase